MLMSILIVLPVYFILVATIVLVAIAIVFYILRLISVFRKLPPTRKLSLVRHPYNWIIVISCAFFLLLGFMSCAGYISAIAVAAFGHVEEYIAVVYAVRMILESLLLTTQQCTLFLVFDKRMFIECYWCCTVRPKWILEMASKNPEDFFSTSDDIMFEDDFDPTSWIGSTSDITATASLSGDHMLKSMEVSLLNDQSQHDGIAQTGDEDDAVEFYEEM